MNKKTTVKSNKWFKNDVISIILTNFGYNSYFSTLHIEQHEIYVPTFL
jgi:hypothetical protein